jgi:hypothetical protein
MSDDEKTSKVWEDQRPLAIGIGLVFLAASFAYVLPRVQLGWQQQLWSIAFVVLSAVGIDSTIHALFTAPFEWSYYWVFKAIAGTSAVLWMLSQRLTTSSILVSSVFFASIISLWYRSIEVVWYILKGGNAVLGSHVPSFVLHSHRVDYADHPVLSALLWAITHTSAFAIPSFVLQHMTRS